MLADEFERRAKAIVSRCEAAIAQRVNAGDSLTVAFREEVRRATAALVQIERDTAGAVAIAAGED